MTGGGPRVASNRFGLVSKLNRTQPKPFRRVSNGKCKNDRTLRPHSKAGAARDQETIMKKLTLTLLAAASMAAAIPAAASAQPAWQAINQRQANLYQRIDAGVARGDLTRPEAIRLQAEFNAIARLEASYRATGGLSLDEQRDLDRRFDALSSRIRFERNDQQAQGQSRQGAWQAINQRQANLYQRIDAGVARGDLTRPEAIRLQAEFNAIARLEASYRATGGLSLEEQRDLDRRFDALSARIRFERNDQQAQGQPGQGVWQNINQRQANLDRRIDRALRDGRISNREARSLRAEFQVIARLEAQYRSTAPGLTRNERADLDRRFDLLSSRIKMEQRDGDRRGGDRYGYGYGPGGYR